MRYKLHKVGSTRVSSAYCPVCRVKTIEITGRLEPQWLGKPINGYYDGLVSPENLCCKSECLDTYKKRIGLILNGWSKADEYKAHGALPNTLEEV